MECHPARARAKRRASVGISSPCRVAGPVAPGREIPTLAPPTLRAGSLLRDDTDGRALPRVLRERAPLPLVLLLLLPWPSPWPLLLPFLVRLRGPPCPPWFKQEPRREPRR